MRCLVAMSAVASPVLRHRSLRCRRRGAQGAGERALTRENWQRENRARELPTLARQRANRPTYSPVPHANGVGEGGTSQRAAPAPLGRAAAMSNPRTVCIAVAESPVAAMLLPEERSQRTPRTPQCDRRAQLQLLQGNTGRGSSSGSGPMQRGGVRARWPRAAGATSRLRRHSSTARAPCEDTRCPSGRGTRSA